MGGSSSKKKPVQVEPPHRDNVVNHVTQPNVIQSVPRDPNAAPRDFGGVSRDFGAPRDFGASRDFGGASRDFGAASRDTHVQLDDYQEETGTVENNVQLDQEQLHQQSENIENELLDVSNNTLSFEQEDGRKMFRMPSPENKPPAESNHVTSSATVILSKPATSTTNNFTTRPPLQFDQNNTQTMTFTHPARPAASDNVMTSSNHVTSSGMMTSSNGYQTGLNQSTRHFGANIASFSNGEGAENQFTKSQNFYNKQSGRFNSYSGSVENHTPSHFSGVYNRHSSQQQNNTDLASLLRKDKFSLLGSQLQQQESQIFSRSQQQTNGLTNGQPRPTGASKITLTSSSPFPASTSFKFDPGKFRRVNETNSTFSTTRNGSMKKTGLGTGPLDERDEELIASIEREFDFTY